MSDKQDTIADIIAEKRELAEKIRLGTPSLDEIEAAVNLEFDADRIEMAWKREKRLLKLCARWILTHDIYANMAKELLAECKEVLQDDGRFLLSEEGAENGKV